MTAEGCPSFPNVQFYSQGLRLALRRVPRSHLRCKQSCSHSRRSRQRCWRQCARPCRSLTSRHRRRCQPIGRSPCSMARTTSRHRQLAAPARSAHQRLRAPRLRRAQRRRAPHPRRSGRSRCRRRTRGGRGRWRGALRRSPSPRPWLRPAGGAHRRRRKPRKGSRLRPALHRHRSLSTGPRLRPALFRRRSPSKGPWPRPAHCRRHRHRSQSSRTVRWHLPSYINYSRRRTRGRPPTCKSCAIGRGRW